MTQPTGELDRLIRDALREEEADALDQFGEQSAMELFTESFRGRRRFLAIGGIIANLLFLGGAIYCASQFLDAGDQRSMLIWGAAAALCVGSVTAIKVWYWLEMVRLALQRDIKRVELQVSLLSQQLSERAGA